MRSRLTNPIFSSRLADLIIKKSINKSNIIALVSSDWAKLVLLWWPEIIGVPRSLKTVADKVQCNIDESTEDGDTDANTSVQVALEEQVCLDHDKEGGTEDDSDEGSNMASNPT